MTGHTVRCSWMSGEPLLLHQGAAAAGAAVAPAVRTAAQVPPVLAFRNELGVQQARAVVRLPKTTSAVPVDSIAPGRIAEVLQQLAAAVVEVVAAGGAREVVLP